MPTLIELKKFFQAKIDRRDAKIAALKEKLDSNPVHAFTWVEESMAATAQAAISAHFLASLNGWEKDREAGKLTPQQPQTEDEAVAHILKIATRQALQRNSNVSRSTSQASNFMESEGAAFYAKLACEWDMLYA